MEENNRKIYFTELLDRYNIYEFFHKLNITKVIELKESKVFKNKLIIKKTSEIINKNLIKENQSFGK